MKTKFLLFFLSFLAMFGCEVGPRYEPPSTPIPEVWKTKTNVEEIDTPPPVCNWWEVFNDDLLNRLEEIAIANNPTLAVAVAHIQEAWATAGINQADLFPQATFDPNYNYSYERTKVKLSRKNPIPIPGLGSGIDRTFNLNIREYSLPINLSYEVDFWGKYRKQYESAVDNAQAQEEGYRVALLSLTSDVASSYYNLRTLNTTAQLLKEVWESRNKDYEINRNRNAKGLVSYIDVTSSYELMAEAESSYFDALRQRGLQENMIAALIGYFPSELLIDDLPLNQNPPQIPPGITADVLLRRPDIAEAERNMAAQHAQINVSYADLFPSFELTSALSATGFQVNHFLKVISQAVAIGANGSQTIFDGGRKLSALELSWAQFYEASGDYKQQVLTAFREVEDALNNLDYEKKQAVSLKNAVDAATKTYQLSQKRYLNGLVNYIEVVDYERTQLNEKLNYINLLGSQYQSTIQLIKALGGGWEPITDCQD